MSDVTIKCNENGPYLVSGPAKVIDAEGNEFDLKGKGKFALCRCTESKNQPFCDGSHNSCGYVAKHLATPAE